jgi:hypothetical protein
VTLAIELGHVATFRAQSRRQLPPFTREDLHHLAAERGPLLDGDSQRRSRSETQSERHDVARMIQVVDDLGDHDMVPIVTSTTRATKTSALNAMSSRYIHPSLAPSAAEI